jgi:hypothetical protein
MPALASVDSELPGGVLGGARVFGVAEGVGGALELGDAMEVEDALLASKRGADAGVKAMRSLVAQATAIVEAKAVKGSV